MSAGDVANLAEAEKRCEALMTTEALRASCPFKDAAREFQPFDLSDPYPFYSYARAQAPIFYADEIGYWVVARHTDIKAVFENWRTFSSENAQAPLVPLGDEARRVMREGGFTAYSGLSARVPPDHTRLRRLVQGCFGPRRFKAIEPQIRAIITRAIDAFIDRGHADFVREFAYDTPALVLFKLVGVPEADVPKVKAWSVSRALLTWGNLSNEEQVDHAHAMVDYWAYCRAIVARRHDDPTDDLPGDLVRLQRDGAEISDEEIAGVLYSVLFAGHETTTSLLGNGLTSLLSHRASWEALLADPTRIPGAVDECLRFSPPIVAWRRKALEDTTIGDVRIAAGANILLLIGSANRDEDAVRQPETLDIGRADARQHLAFGYGIHACVGQQLSKLEMDVALQELTRRIPSLRLAPDQKGEFLPSISFRVPTSIGIEWDTVAA